MRFCLAAAVGLSFVGCYKPALQTGSPCDATHPCPDGLICSAATATCEAANSAVDGAVSDAAPDARILIDGCTPVPEICGDGIDQDCDNVDPPCPANDKPAGAIDVTAGGSFVVDMKFATDDAGRPVTGTPFCGGVGGREVFYKVHLTADEAYYFDTFGSDFDSVIRVYHGTCAGGPAPSGVRCRNDACTVTQSQGVFDLTAGDTCIVIDQYSDVETNGSLHLHVERGHRTGSPLATGTQVTNGTTVGGTDQGTGTCALAGNDVGYYFTACPSQTYAVTASTCNASTSWDTAIYLRGPAGQIACNDDDSVCAASSVASTISTTASGAHLFFLVVDAGAAAASGTFELDTTIQ